MCVEGASIYDVALRVSHCKVMRSQPYNPAVNRRVVGFESYLRSHFFSRLQLSAIHVRSV